MDDEVSLAGKPRVTPGGWVALPVVVGGTPATVVVTQDMGSGVVDDVAPEIEIAALAWYLEKFEPSCGLLVHRLVRAARAMMPAAERAKLTVEVLCPLAVTDSTMARMKVRYAGREFVAILQSDLRVSIPEARPSEGDGINWMAIDSAVYAEAELRAEELASTGFDTTALTACMLAADRTALDLGGFEVGAVQLLVC